jgi:hypothetical protein
LEIQCFVFCCGDQVQSHHFPTSLSLPYRCTSCSKSDAFATRQIAESRESKSICCNMDTFSTSLSPPPAPQGETPRLYMTPHIAKRKDGICPSLLQFNGTNGSPTIDKPGHVIKTYQTNSDLLLQIKDRQGTPRSVMELQTIIEVINKALKALCTDPDKQLIARLKFKPEGCIWRLAFHPSLGNSADQSYRAEVICFANAAEEANSEGDRRTNYLIESTLIPASSPVDDADRPSTLIPSHLEGYKEAKAAFEIIAVAVRKAVVRLEFPNFPHGGGPALFRDIYQLNARVRSWFRASCHPT